MSAEDNRISFPASVTIIRSLRDIGVATQEHRLRVLTSIVKRQVKSTKSLTRDELPRVRAAIQARQKEQEQLWQQQ